MTPDCNQVRAVHRVAGVRVSDEEAEVDVIRATTTVNVRDADGHDLFVRRARQRDAHFVTTEGGCACGSRAADDLGSTRDNRRVKGKDSPEAAACTYELRLYTPFPSMGAGRRTLNGSLIPSICAMMLPDSLNFLLVILGPTKSTKGIRRLRRMPFGYEFL